MGYCHFSSFRQGFYWGWRVQAQKPKEGLLVVGRDIKKKFATLSKLVVKGLHVAIAEPNLAHIVCQISPDELTIRVGYMNGHFVFLVIDLKQKARALSTPC